MTPIEFPGCNVTFAKDQPEYIPLPAMVLPDTTVYTCWELTEEEAARVMANRKIYLKQICGVTPAGRMNQLQPIMPNIPSG